MLRSRVLLRFQWKSPGSIGHIRTYATNDRIPVIPSVSLRSEDRLPDAVPPQPPIAGSEVVVGTATHTTSKPPSSPTKAVPFATEPILLESTKPRPVTHRFRNTILTTLLGIGLVYGGGLYASLQNDTIYELYTEFLPYGEELVLYVQEQEFRNRFPGATKHTGKPASSRSTAANVYIPSSGAQAKIRDDVSSDEQLSSSKTGPQFSAIKQEHKATPGGATDVQRTNATAVKQAGAKNEALSESAPVLAELPQGVKSAKSSVTAPKSSPSVLGSPRQEAPASQVQRSVPVIPNSVTSPPKISPTDPQTQLKSDVVTEPMPPPTKPIKTFDIANAYDRSIERMQFAINGIIKAANEYGSSPFFQASLENAKDEVLELNRKISNIKSETNAEAEKKLTILKAQIEEQHESQVANMKSQIAEYEQRLAKDLENEQLRLNQAYTERLAEEVEKIKAVNEQKLKNELTEQAIEMQRKLNKDIKKKVEQERDSRLGKLSDLQKSIAELKELSVASASFVDERAKIQDLEVALNVLKNVLSSPRPRPFIKELAAIKELSAKDDLIRATLDTIAPESYENGVPSLVQLSDRFRPVAEEARKSALLSEGSGIAGHATSWLFSKLTFRKSGLVSGNDVDAVLARTEAHLEAGDLDSATREMNQLKGWAKVICSDWLKLARRHLEVQQSVDIIEQSLVLRALQAQ